ncbi:hypothetical protein PPACK8108_LOCUS19391 [Phakopsora pachyrhizi]|uniref:Tet-like 2OG-Fe(II) oxygenase domain-containing protein n=1 Tax=Phakopsora pachyrhizi TaxID=170000 RepID=A0AAV0BCB5_PHAPC|nr:hypothetical protein PPACK8108_LOCUS19391 [Phakopsora pachyrhizi]
MQHRKGNDAVFWAKHNIKKIFHCYVPMVTSDPVPHERFSFHQRLKKFYRPLYKNKVRVFQTWFFPFEDMMEGRKNKKKSSLISGTMYAEGWRKEQVSNQIFGRYINQNKLNHQMTIKGFSQDEEAAGFMKMGNFLSTVFQESEGKLLS